MNKINGYDDEYEFISYINNKKVKELDSMFRKFVDEIFPNENEETIIKSWRNHYHQKSDIFIKINNKMKGISIKNSVHVEPISEFIHFLIENHVPKEVVVEYLKYQYADGTTNGSGKKRISSEQYKILNQEKIDKINDSFNKVDILEKAIDKFVIKGNNSNYYISAIIYGEIDDFIWITTEDIKKVIMSKKNVYSTGGTLEICFVNLKIVV